MESNISDSLFRPCAALQLWSHSSLCSRRCALLKTCPISHKYSTPYDQLLKDTASGHYYSAIQTQERIDNPLVNRHDSATWKVADHIKTDNSGFLGGYYARRSDGSIVCYVTKAATPRDSRPRSRRCSALYGQLPHMGYGL